MFGNLSKKKLNEKQFAPLSIYALSKLAHFIFVNIIKMFSI